MLTVYNKRLDKKLDDMTRNKNNNNHLIRKSSTNTRKTSRQMEKQHEEHNGGKETTCKQLDEMRNMEFGNDKLLKTK